MTIKGKLVAFAVGKPYAKPAKEQGSIFPDSALMKRLRVMEGAVSVQRIRVSPDNDRRKYL